MAFNLLTGDIAAISVFTQFDEQVGINRHHFHVGVIAGTPTDVDVVEALEPILRGHYALLMSAAADFSGLGIVVWRNQVIQTNNFYKVSPATPGNVAGDPLPGQVSGLIKKVSDLPGKKAYGRSYVPFPSEADNFSTGKPTADYVVRLQTLADYLEAPGNFTSGGKTWGLSGRHKWKVSSPPALYSFAVVTQMIARASWATMRSRGDYGAANELPWD